MTQMIDDSDERGYIDNRRGKGESRTRTCYHHKQVGIRNLFECIQERKREGQQQQPSHTQWLGLGLLYKYQNQQPRKKGIRGNKRRKSTLIYDYTCILSPHSNSKPLEISKNSRRQVHLPQSVYVLPCFFCSYAQILSFLLVSPF